MQTSDILQKKCNTMNKQIAHFLQIVFLAATYYVTGKIGLLLDPVGGFATLIWLPTGISLATLLFFGPRLSPGIFLGAFLVNFTSHAPFLLALCIAIGNMLEVLVGYWLLKKFDFHYTFDRLHDVIQFILLAAIGSTLVSATIGTISLLLGHVIVASEFVHTFSAWWIGDMLSNLLIVPTIFLVLRKISLVFNKERIIEKLIVWTLVWSVSIVIFTNIIDIFSIRNAPRTFLVFPPLIWMALRFSQAEVVAATVVVALVAIWGTFHGMGPFVLDRLSSSLLYLQSFIAVLVTTTMILGAAVAERRFLERQKDDFISVASHELKAPLAIIKAYVQLLKKQHEDKKEKKVNAYLSKVYLQIGKMTQLINDFLDVSKIESGKLKLQKRAFNIDNLLHQIIIDLQHTTQRITIVKRGNVHAKIYGDKNRIAQVFINLIVNAIKYSPSGKKIYICVKKRRQYIQVSIQDFGIGMKKEYQARIFDRFFRITDSKQNAFFGFGLGLYIAKEIVKQHNGEIRVESKKGKGSTFIVSLPTNRVD